MSEKFNIITDRQTDGQTHTQSDFLSSCRSQKYILDEVKSQLRFFRIRMEQVTYFDRITKDNAAKFLDMISAIGGTMGLLTGFSIISGVEILYFTAKMILQFLKRNCR